MLVITNRKIGTLYYDVLGQLLKKAGFEVHCHFVPDSENAKSQKSSLLSMKDLSHVGLIGRGLSLRWVEVLLVM